MRPGELIFITRHNMVIVWKDVTSEDEVGELMIGDAVVVTGFPKKDQFTGNVNETRRLIPVMTRIGTGFVWDIALETR